VEERREEQTSEVHGVIFGKRGEANTCNSGGIVLERINEELSKEEAYSNMREFIYVLARLNGEKPQIIQCACFSDQPHQR
jgi:hypothetical protein